MQSKGNSLCIGVIGPEEKSVCIGGAIELHTISIRWKYRIEKSETQRIPFKC